MLLFCLLIFQNQENNCQIKLGSNLLYSLYQDLLFVKIDAIVYQHNIQIHLSVQPFSASIHEILESIQKDANDSLVSIENYYVFQ